MAIFKSGYFDLNTALGLQSVEVGFRPKAVIFYSTMGNQVDVAASSTSAVGLNYMVGWGVAPDKASYSAFAFPQDYLIADIGPVDLPNSSGYLFSVDKCMGHCDHTGAVIWEAQLSSLDDYGFSIDITTAPEEPWRIMFFAIGGDEVTATAGYTSMVPSGGGQIVDDLGFDADLIFAMHTQSLIPGGGTPMRFGFGVAGEGSGATALFHKHGFPVDVQSVAAFNQSTLIGLSGHPTNALFEAQVFTTFGGFEMLYLTEPDRPYLFSYLALNHIRNRIWPDQQPLTPGLKSVNVGNFGFRFAPQAALAVSINQPASFAIRNNSAVFMLGSTSKPGSPFPGVEYAAWGEVVDGVALGRAAGLQGNAFVVFADYDVVGGEVDGEGGAFVESFNKDPYGMGLWWAAPGDNVAREYLGIFLGSYDDEALPLMKPIIPTVPYLNRRGHFESSQAPGDLSDYFEKHGYEAGQTFEIASANAVISDSDVGKGTDVGTGPGQTDPGVAVIPQFAVTSHMTDGASATDGTVYTTASFAPQANALALVAVLSMGAGAPAPTLSGGGMTTWTQVATQALTWGRVTVFRALQASPGAPAALTITHGSSVQACVWSADQVIGVVTSGTNGSGAVAQAALNVGYGQTGLSKPALFSDPDNFLWGVVAHQAQGATTQCRGFIETADRNTGDIAAPGNLETAWSAYLPDVSWGWADASEWITIGVEVVVSGGVFPPGAPTNFPTTFLLMNLNDPSSETKAWQSISDRIVSWKKNGPRRQFELDSIEGGTAEFKLRNHDRALDPQYTSGPFYGHLYANREIALILLYNGHIYPMFYGFVEDYDAERTGFSGNYTTIKANDATEILASEPVDSGHAVLVTNFGSNKDIKFTSKGATQVSLAKLKRKGPFGGDGDPPELGAGPGEDIKIEYVLAWNEAYPTGARYFQDRQVVRILLRNVAGNPGSTAEEIVQAVNSEPIVSQLLFAEIAPGQTGTGKPPKMSETPLDGGFVREYTGYRINQALSSLEPPWPLGDRIINSGVELLQAAAVERKNNVAAWQHLTDAAVTTELGVLFVDARGRIRFQARNYRDSIGVSAIFTDLPHATEYPYVSIKPHYDNKKVFNEITVNQNSSEESVTVSDQTSKNRFRKRAKTLTVMAYLVPSLSTIANYLLAKYKDQKVRYDTMSVTWGSGMPVGMLDNLLGMEISNLVTIRRSPSTGPQITSNHFVEGYDVECTEEKVLNFTIYVSPQ